MSESHPCRHAEDVAPFAIGALDEHAAQAFADHLATCASCRTGHDDFKALALMLPLAAERQSPPPELKQRVMSVVRAEAELLRAAGPEADRVARRSLRSRWWARMTARPLALTTGGVATAAAVLIAVVVLAGGGSEVRTIQARVTVPAATAKIQVVDNAGTLVASGMPAPSRGHVYAVWTQRSGESPRLAGTLGADGKGEMRLKLSGGIDRISTVMVTVEPRRVGADPTTRPVMVAELA